MVPLCASKGGWHNKYLVNFTLCVLFITGGWNNNPTVLHFKAAFRRLIAHAGASTSGDSGNVTTQDTTQLIQGSSVTYVPPDAVREDATSALVDDRLVLHDHSYIGERLGSLIDNILVYIAGYVVRKAMSQITCDECRSALVSHEPSEKYGSAYCFLRIRNSGSLAIPSEGVVAIVFAAERHLRAPTDLNKVNQACTLLRVQTKVLAQLGAKNC